MGLKQADPKSNEHKFALCIVKQKGYAKTNGVKGKWKVLRGSTCNTQVQVVGGGEGARREAEGKKNHQKKEFEKSDDALDDETCHATKKKGTISETRNIMMSPTLAAKERSGPSLTSGLSDHTGKGGRGI
jgi:hypothetical protein